MRNAAFLVAAMALHCATPAVAQVEDPMEQQRCVWRCLADARGNTDPAYHACVARHCTESAAPAAAGPARAAPPAARRGEMSPAGRVDRMTVTVVQRALIDLGLYQGPVDGVYGGGTAAAVQSFRVSRGLGSGGIDNELVWTLRQASAGVR